MEIFMIISDSYAYIIIEYVKIRYNLTCQCDNAFYSNER